MHTFSIILNCKHDTATHFCKSGRETQSFQCVSDGIKAVESRGHQNKAGLAQKNILSCNFSEGGYRYKNNHINADKDNPSTHPLPNNVLSKLCMCSPCREAAD
jgi:hypothetical protein